MNVRVFDKAIYIDLMQNEVTNFSMGLDSFDFVVIRMSVEIFLGRYVINQASPNPEE